MNCLNERERHRWDIWLSLKGQNCYLCFPETHFSVISHFSEIRGMGEEHRGKRQERLTTLFSELQFLMGCLSSHLEYLYFRDFPGSPVVKTWHYQCRGRRLDPWYGDQGSTCHTERPKFLNFSIKCGDFRFSMCSCRVWLYHILFLVYIFIYI